MGVGYDVMGAGCDVMVREWRDGAGYDVMGAG